MDVTSADLALYLGQDVNEARAGKLIELATDQVAEYFPTRESIPQAAAAVVLSAVARSYANPTQVSNEMVGPYQAGRPSGGVYLSKPERASLRRLAGRSGAFSIDLLPPGYPCGGGL